MGKISQMISVRNLLRKMRTHAVVSVLSAVVLVTLLCGYVVYAAVRHIGRGQGDTYVEEGDQVLVSVTEEVEAELLLQTEVVSGQLETLRLSLDDLHGKVDSSAGAVSVIEGMMGSLGVTDTDTGAAVTQVSARLHELGTEITNAFDKIEAVSAALSSHDAQDAERTALLLSQMEDINATMNWISTRYASVSEEILAITEQLKGSALYTEADIVSGVAALEEQMTGSITEFTSAALQLQALSASLEERLTGILAGLDLETEMTGLQTGIDEANRKLDLLLAGGAPGVVRAASATGDALPWQVLSGKTFVVTQDGEEQTALGTMPDHSDIGPVVLQAGEVYTFEEGYYPAFTVTAQGGGAPVPSAGTMTVSHHVHSNVSTTETVMSASMEPTADGPADTHVSMTYGGCYTVDSGTHTHTAACYTSKTERVAVDQCPASGQWEGPFGPDSTGRQYWVASCVICGANVGTSYSPAYGGIPSHSRGRDHVEYTNRTTTSVTCGLQEGTIYAIGCGHTRGEVMGYSVTFD